MLAALRVSGFTKALMGVVVLLIIAAFALPTTGIGSPRGMSDVCAVDYAGHCVDEKDYFAAFGLIARGLAIKDIKALKLRQKTLEGLTERELLYAEAKRLGLGVSDDAVEEELTAGRAHVSLPVADAEGLALNLLLCRRDPRGMGCEPGATLGVRQLRVRRGPSEPFDYKLYERELRIVANRGPREFRQFQERELTAERLRELIRVRVRVPESEAFAIFERASSRAVVRSAIVDRAWFARYALDTSEAAIEKWAAQHAAQVDDLYKGVKDDFKNGCPVVSELAVKLPPNASDEEKKGARERLAALRERVLKGESLSAVAREASEAESAPFGGRVGCLGPGYGSGADVLRVQADKLEKGALSEIIETPSALVVLRLEEKLDQAAAERQGRAQIAEKLYARLTADEAARAFAQKLIAQVKAGAKLEEVVRAASDEIARGFASTPATKGKDASAMPPALLAPNRPRFEVSPPFNASGNPVPDVEPKESLSARAFRLDEPDAIDETPIETSTGYLVLQLKEKTAASREEFDKEKAGIMANLRQAKAADALARYVGELRREAGDKLKVHAEFAEDPKSQSDEP